MNDEKYGFIFGAGAETCFNIPLGEKYVELSLYRKNTELYAGLELFYKNRIENNKGYVDKYFKEFMFANNSAVFFDIIRESVQDNKDIANIDESSKEIIKIVSDYQEHSELKDYPDLKKKYDEFYNNIINGDSGYEAIKNYLLFYGFVEKDFSTIIDPKKVGIKKFWRLINFFWSAFFTIILPILDYFTEYPNCNEYKKNKYSYVLNNLNEVIDCIYSDDFIKQDCFQKDNYYFGLKNSFNPECVMTTNYTPFIKKIFGENKVIYLSGELLTFELPIILDIKKAGKDQYGVDMIDEKDFVFPYLHTQAPIKPIINVYELKEYAKALKQFEVLDKLVIIGYSLCKNDNHIIALLRDFVLNEKKQIIYCDYSKDGIESSKGKICEALHIENKNTDRVIIINNTGNVDDLQNKLKKLL